jgi:hypothetical protein
MGFFSEPSGGPETASEGTDRAEPRSSTEGAQEGAERPWWRTVFGRRRVT